MSDTIISYSSIDTTTHGSHVLQWDSLGEDWLNNTHSKFQCKLYTPEDIKNIETFKTASNNQNFANVFKSSRGAGYWLWKPILIWEALKNLNMGDMLIYTDVKYHIDSTATEEQITMLKAKINKTKHKLLVPSMSIDQKYVYKGNIVDARSDRWVTDKVQHYFRYTNESLKNIYLAPAGALFLIKANESIDIINKFKQLALNQPDLFTEGTSTRENFCESRHDQSIWTLLCDKNNVEKMYPNPATGIRQWYRALHKHCYIIKPSSYMLN